MSISSENSNRWANYYHYPLYTLKDFKIKVLLKIMTKTTMAKHRYLNMNVDTDERFLKLLIIVKNAGG